MPDVLTARVGEEAREAENAPAVELHREVRDAVDPRLDEDGALLGQRALDPALLRRFETVRRDAQRVAATRAERRFHDVPCARAQRAANGHERMANSDGKIVAAR